MGAPTTVAAIIARNLRSIRDAAGLSQEEMAAQLGIHTGTYTRYEQERSKPRHEVLMRIADAFGYESSDVLTRPNAPPPKRLVRHIGAVEFELDGCKIVADFHRVDGKTLDSKQRGEIARRLRG